MRDGDPCSFGRRTQTGAKTKTERMSNHQASGGEGKTGYCTEMQTLCSSKQTCRVVIREAGFQTTELVSQYEHTSHMLTSHTSSSGKDSL